MLTYQIENDLPVQEFREVLIRSTLGERRPVDAAETLAAMLANATLIVTARENGRLIGVCRALTDFAYCTYVSELAVDAGYQHQGIGKALIQQTKQAAPKARLILLAAPKAREYYAKIGMTRHEYAFYLDE